ncbi:hypothetical protein C2G38_2047386 [Gigaspora rosea]|uniref:TLDc domain-containing protein n=1 Tax=Gigaspora rosea TaxID=44941 RepID=A0A397UEZ9_9GLOM|nr:hypothetical protein C2G38_2047386 [Gigaspora rosea]
MSIKHFEKLSNNYIELLEKGDEFNVIIKVGKSKDIKEFKVHSAILKYRSSYFRDRYIYGGFISLESFDTQLIFDLILIADEFVLEELVDFNSLNETALVSLIKRDDLQMEEIKIWNYVVKWGIAQNPNLTSDPEEWTYENFMILKDTLKNCLSHIRYFQMSAILPPRIILKTELPIRSSEPFSTVINEEHAAEIASWIDKNNTTYSIKNNPYEFKLLLRGSKDGFTCESFWNLCNKKANTVTVINVKGNDNIERIFGGYNPLEWDNSEVGWARCHDSFVFSLKNSAIQNSILSRVKDSNTAIYNYGNYGVFFGHQLGMFLRGYNGQYNGCCTHYCPGNYEKQIDMVPPKSNQYYFVNEYEVFQIHKRKE